MVLEQLGIRRHLPGRRRAPPPATLTRFLAALDGDALDAAIGTYLAERDHIDAGGTGFAHDGPATIELVNAAPLTLAA